MTDMDAATGAGLKEFLDWVVKRGEINPSTGNAQRVAATKILASEDDPDRTDIRALDVERLLYRFENQNRTSYSTASLATYKTRFRNAVSMYLAWLDGDPTWKNVIRTRRSSQPSRLTRSASVKTDESDTEVAESSRPVRTYARSVSAPTVTYQLPLRPDLLVQIELPVDLNPSDADRVAAFVRSLAFRPATSSAGSDTDPDDASGED